MKGHNLRFDEVITDKDYENSSISLELGKSENQIEAELAFNKMFLDSKVNNIPSLTMKNKSQFI